MSLLFVEYKNQKDFLKKYVVPVAVLRKLHINNIKILSVGHGWILVDPNAQRYMSSFSLTLWDESVER